MGSGPRGLGWVLGALGLLSVAAAVVPLVREAGIDVPRGDKPAADRPGSVEQGGLAPALPGASAPQPAAPPTDPGPATVTAPSPAATPEHPASAKAPGEQAAPAAEPVAPALFSARRADGALILAGTLPGAEVKAELLALARRRFLTERIVDETRLGDGLPETFAAGAAFGLEQLAELAAGELSLRGTTFALKGEALYAQVAERVRDAARRAPKPWTLAAEIARRGDLAGGPDLCQQQLTDRLAQRGIRFEPDSAEIARPSFPLLNDLADIARRCPGARIEIAGALGEGPENEWIRELWRRRAQAVSQYLRKAGVDQARLASEPEPPAEPTPGAAGRSEAEPRGERLLVRF